MENKIQYYIQRGEGMNGIKSHRVRSVQECLYYLGFLTSAPDGCFGPNTEKAVKKAQSMFSMEENGIVDVTLFQKLAEEVICNNPKG